jgi:hypothetical protein
VLKTTSPTAVPLAPKERPDQTEPSSRTRRQSWVFQGFSTAADLTVEWKERDGSGVRARVFGSGVCDRGGLFLNWGLGGVGRRALRLRVTGR